jgi:hypothetical protein
MGTLQQPKRGGKAGMGVDASGGPVIDPTENVIALVSAEKLRSDDLRKGERRFLMAQVAAVRREMKLRAQHQAQMDSAESARIDSIRLVDVTALQTLAVTTQATAEALRTLVTTTAAGLATQTASERGESNKRLSLLEQSSFTELGKQKVADPQLERLSMMVENLARSRASDTGKVDGIGATWKAAIAVVGLLAGLNALGVFNRAPVYTPAPYGTQLPTTPPASVPR